MTHTVIDSCQDCMYTDCVTVCPVDCFYGDREKENMIYIHPDECIDCGACIPECPVEAILPEDEVPEDKQKWTPINAEKCASGDLEVISEKLDELPTAAEKKKQLGF